MRYKAAEELSPNTLQSYQRDLKLWLIYAGDVPIHTLSTKLIQNCFVWWRTDYQSRRLKVIADPYQQRQATTSISARPLSSLGPFKACEFSAEVQSNNRPKFIMRRWADKRDQPITSDSFNATLPAASIMLFVTSPAVSLDKQVYLPIILK